jgi:hypothetical protein
MNAALDENDEAMVVGEEIGCTVFKLQLVVGPDTKAWREQSEPPQKRHGTYIRTTYYVLL